MRRRRIRIRRHTEDQQQTSAPPVVAKATTFQVEVAEPSSPMWLKPVQQQMLDIQQHGGNQLAMRAMRSMVQRLPAVKDEQDEQEDERDEQKDASKKNAVSEVVDTGGAQDASDMTSDESLLQEAITAHKEKKYGKALIAFRELYIRRQSSQMLINMGMCEMRLDLFPEAQDDLQTALEDEGLNMPERTRATMALDSVRKLEGAVAVGFMKLPPNVDTDNSPLAKEPRAIRNQIMSFYRSAEGSAKSEDYEAALNAFQIAQKRLPHPVTQINIAKCLIMLQKYPEAAAMFDRALHDKTCIGPMRKVAEAELEAAKRFQELHFDNMGALPPAD